MFLLNKKNSLFINFFFRYILLIIIIINNYLN